MMIQKTENDSRKALLFVLLGVTLAFVILQLPHFIFGVSFITEDDELVQYHVALIKCRRYLIEVLNKLFNEHVFEPVMWDMSMGLGEDPLITLHYYGISCPLMLLTLLFKEDEASKAFGLMFYIFIVISALGIYLIGKKRNWNKYQLLSAALLYCFSSFNIIIARRSICYMYPVALFPFMVYGIDLMFENKKPWVYYLATVMLGWLNFYCFYEAGIFICLYVLFKFFLYRDIPKEEKRKAAFIRFPIYSILAILTDAVILLPVIQSGLNSNRLGELNNLNLFYTREFYLEYFITILGFNRIGLWYGFFGFTVISVISAAALFLKRNDTASDKRQKVLLLTGIAFSLLPVAGLILSVFTYPTNRWIWALGLVVAFIVGNSLNELTDIKPGNKRLLMFIALVFCALSIITPLTWEKKSFVLVIGSIILTVLFIYGIGRMNIKYRPALACLCVFLAIALNFYCEFYMSGFDRIKGKFFTHEKVYELLRDEETNAILPTENEPYRYDYAGHSVYKNTPAVSERYAINGYWSLGNPYTIKAFSDFGNYMQMSFNYNDLDSRIILDRIFGVKYYLVQEDYEDRIPYSYFPTGKTAETSRDEAKVELYDTDLSLPFGFTYSNTINADTFEQLDKAKRQEALLYGAVTDHSGLKEIKPEYKSREILKNIEEGSAVSIEDKTISVRSDGGSCVLNVEPVRNSEVYVYFEIDEMDVPDKASKLDFPRGLLKAEGDDRKDYIIDLLKGERVDSTRIGVSAYDMEFYRNVKIHTKYSEFDADKTEYFVNMGYFEESPSEFTLHFADLGTYRFKDIQVYAQDMKTVDEQTEKLKEHTIHDLKFDTNTVTGRIEVPDKRLLFMSIPYSKGWRAYVDGVETEVHQTNVLGLGIELEPGEHEVVFKYFTPYLKEGAVISLIGLIGFVIIMLCFRRFEENKNDQTRS